MTTAHDFEQLIVAAWPPFAWQDVTVLIAVSGGADSVALLRGLARVKSDVGGAGRLLAAHFNHALRGAESDGDERFVVELSRQLGLECRVGRVPGSVLESRGDGLEAAAREARYRFLQTTAEAAGARYVVTAHTADDQAETILHRVIRGTGIAGLAGMPRVRSLGPAACLLRPLLEIRRSQIEAYLTAIGQYYRTDSTNQTLELTRNRLRHRLLPLLAEEFNPSVVESLLRLGKLAGDAQETIHDQAAVLLEGAIVSHADNGMVLDCKRMACARRHLIREALVLAWQRHAWPLQAMTFAHWDELAEFVVLRPGNSAQSWSRKIFPGEITATRELSHLRVAREPE